MCSQALGTPGLGVGTRQPWLASRPFPHWSLIDTQSIQNPGRAVLALVKRRRVDRFPRGRLPRSLPPVRHGLALIDVWLGQRHLCDGGPLAIEAKPQAATLRTRARVQQQESQYYRNNDRPRNPNSVREKYKHSASQPGATEIVPTLTKLSNPLRAHVGRRFDETIGHGRTVIFIAPRAATNAATERQQPCG
jgi:hypothetical protein